MHALVHNEYIKERTDKRTKEGVIKRRRKRKNEERRNGVR